MLLFRERTKATELNLPALMLILGVLLVLAGAVFAWPLMFVGAALAMTGGLVLGRRWESLHREPVLEIHADALVWNGDKHSFDDIQAVRHLLLEGRRGFTRPQRAMFVEFPYGPTLLIDPQLENWARAQEIILSRVPPTRVHVEGSK